MKYKIKLFALILVLVAVGNQFLFKDTFFDLRKSNKEVNSEDFYKQRDYTHVRQDLDALSIHYLNDRFTSLFALEDTTCIAQAVPFLEGFDKRSKTIDCWTILNNNGDDAFWKVSTSFQAGDQAMSFLTGLDKIGAPVRFSDDWLISPKITLESSKIYKLSYFSKTSSSLLSGGRGDFEVKLSTTGIDPNSFTHTLVDLKTIRHSSYIEDIVYIKGIGGDVNIGWHIEYTGVNDVYIDEVYIEEVGCVKPLISGVKNIESDHATFYWEDNINDSWEYVLQKAGLGIPSVSGIMTNVKEVTLTKDVNGANLVPNSKYEFYVRANCTNGENTEWRGPYEMFTLCSGSKQLPFSEGFETFSLENSCWRIIDGNSDDVKWDISTLGPHSGTSSMLFIGAAGKQHDEWLISPSFQLEQSKFYKLTYNYKTKAGNVFNPSRGQFEVLLSKGGILNEDATVLVPVKTITNSTYTEEEVYIYGVDGLTSIMWHVSYNGAVDLYLDTILVEEVDCIEPKELKVKEIETDKVTLYWEDKVNSEWEYYVQKKGAGEPLAKGILSLTNEVIVNKDINNLDLLPGTSYEYYLRSKCSNGKYSIWVGPKDFYTVCGTVGLPFTENFEEDSPTVKCWTILNNDGDSNTWTLSKTTPYEKAYSMRYSKSGGIIIGPFSSNDIAFNPTALAVSNKRDLLISPSFELDKSSIYELSYYYKAIAAGTAMEVLLSNSNDIKPDSFSEVLVSDQVYKNTDYVKKTVYIREVEGIVNIAWHISSSSNGTMYIDFVNLKKVDCISPDDNVLISDVESDRATFKWEDDENLAWEYYLQPIGKGTPSASGVLSRSNTLTVSRESTTGSPVLKPNTEYEFYLRSNCGLGKNSSWLGPYTFRTLCARYSPPYWEGFNQQSDDINCWTIINLNGDSTSSNSNIWRPYTIDFYEGDGSMYFYGFNNTLSQLPHNDWLISPAFILDPNKYYRLKYKYKTNSSYWNNYEVLYSTDGTDVSSFTKVLLSRSDDGKDSWTEESITLKGNIKDVHIAWRVTSKKVGTMFLLDDVSIEEIVGCPEPFDMKVENEKGNEVTLVWSDDISSNWEYIVQKPTNIIPDNSSVGVQTNANSAIVDKDINGVNLIPNTEYVYYVRTVCSGNGGSDWIGPLVFRTSCTVISLPFWEGFNRSSDTKYCWTIIDVNSDAVLTKSTDKWNFTNMLKYEGDQSMGFSGTSTKTHDDWVVSPIFNFEASKFYRLKYRYRTNSTATYALLLSDSGMDTNSFNKVILPAKTYKDMTDWQEEYLFITGVSGDVNLGWHISSVGSSNFYIDNIFLEEVQGCPEPMSLGVKDVGIKDAVLVWKDDMGGSEYEYFVQEVDKGIPSENGVSTSDKEVKITTDVLGNRLVGNTDYEFYVRTLCGDEEFSIWSGPYLFTTLCDVYVSPFWDGFNTNTKTIRCWTIIDNYGDIIEPGITWKTTATSFEGNRAFYFHTKNSLRVPFDDWLLSPTITMDGGLYVLKYHYRTTDNSSDLNQFEVLLSNEGIETTKFKKVLVPNKAYHKKKYLEEVVFIDGVSGDVNVGWHVNGKDAEESHLYLDNVYLKKVETCPEPYYVKVIDQSINTIEIEWQQYGNLSEWEVLVVEYGHEESSSPIKRQMVSGAPKTIITGLEPGTAYTIFVRAKCLDKVTYSDWSTGTDGATKVGANDDCDGARVVPVNRTTDCLKSINASLIGATKSMDDKDDCVQNLLNDVWFTFTATSSRHEISISDVVDLSGNEADIEFFGALYNQGCGVIGKRSLACFPVGATGRKLTLSNVTPGQVYYLRLGARIGVMDHIVFKLCIVSSEFSSLKVEPSGSSYSVEDLVKEVLIASNCDVVDNIKYQVGDGNNTINALGYFNKANADFPFEEGIVLSTGDVKHVGGPYNYVNINDQREKIPVWTGDPDLNKVINDLGGSGFGSNKSVAVLEFDFIPINDSIQFEYLFASQSYHKDCTNYGCSEGGALFAAWLTDLETGEGQNLALVPNTNLPIALSTIRDTEKSKLSCESRNPEYYGKHYSEGFDHPLDAPINFVGLTKALSSEKVAVKSCKKYRIKLAITDFCSSPGHTSAVFFNARSFDLGKLDLGSDLTVENLNAVCNTSSYTIKSGIDLDDCGGVEIEWYKDNVLIPNETNPDIEVKETGDYEIMVRYSNLNCEARGSVRVEVYPLISEVVHDPIPLEVCRFSLNEREVILSIVEEAMFKDVKRDDYSVHYYVSKNDAEVGTSDNSIHSLTIHGIENEFVYIRVDDHITGCFEVFELAIIATKGDLPNPISDVKVCASYTLPDLAVNQYYYSQAGGQGINYQAGDVINTSGDHLVYVLQKNGEDGCYEETSFKVSITERVLADVFEDLVLDCSIHYLAPLSNGNKYFDKARGQGNELEVGKAILTDQTIYIYATSTDELCEDESSYTITYKQCPIQKGISPNGDGVNEYFDLSNHRVSSLKIFNRYGLEVYTYGVGYTTEWVGQDQKGNALPDGTYYYVVITQNDTRTGWIQINR